MKPRLQGRVALVTGGSRGIGEAIAVRLAEEGARVVISARKQDGLDAAVSRAGALGVTLEGRTCHAGQRADVAALIAGVAASHGRLDILVNNAATNPYFGPMQSAEEAAFDKTFEVNVKGYFFAIQAFVKETTARGGGGSVVNVASIVGLRAAPFQSIYGMTKAAIISMTQSLAVELASSRIRVNAIAPGFVETKFSQAILDNPALREQVLSHTPQNRYASPEEIAGTAAYLASDDASFVTGQTLVVDGGYTCV